jgi:hypothetical protein
VIRLRRPECLGAHVEPGHRFGCCLIQFDQSCARICLGSFAANPYLRELKLFEVSLVVMPMNELATVSSVKAAEPDLGPAIRELQELLKNTRKAWK